MAKISLLNPHDLSGTAWAFATLSLSHHEPLLQAISAASIPMLCEFNSQDLANTAWSFATRCFKNPQLMDSQSAEVLAKLGEFAPQGLATTAWAYSSLGVTDPTLLNAISAEVLRKLDEIEAQSLGILADAKLPCRQAVERTLQPLAERFIGELPHVLNPTRIAAFTQFVRDVRIDNFGAWGTRLVLERIGFREPPPDFVERALRQIRLGLGSVGAGADDRRTADAEGALAGTALVHRRVFSYAEYEVEATSDDSGSGRLVAGSIIKENGRRDRNAEERLVGGTRTSVTWPALKPLASPISSLVDRSLCSEFQVLRSMPEEAAMAAAPVKLPPPPLRGRLRLFVSTAPCVSCIWALRQFQLLHPSMQLEVANGEEAYLFST